MSGGSRRRSSLGNLGSNSLLHATLAAFVPPKLQGSAPAPAPTPASAPAPAAAPQQQPETHVVVGQTVAVASAKPPRPKRAPTAARCSDCKPLTHYCALTATHSTVVYISALFSSGGGVVDNEGPHPFRCVSRVVNFGCVPKLTTRRRDTGAALPGPSGNAAQQQVAELLQLADQLLPTESPRAGTQEPAERPSLREALKESWAGKVCSMCALRDFGRLNTRRPLRRATTSVSRVWFLQTHRQHPNDNARHRASQTRPH